MQAFPHYYKVQATATPEGDVSLDGEGLETIASAPPAEFGGPGNRWSPESLLIAAVADCFVLSFRAIARASKLSWNSLECDVTGALDRVEGKSRFTEITVAARLRVPGDANEERAQRLLQKAEESCLVTNSLSAAVHLETSITKAP